MDYRQQEQYFFHSRLWGAGCVLVLFAFAAACLAGSSGTAGSSAVLFALSVAALAVFLYYTPDYLHLTVNPEKRARWAVRVRWRLIAAALIAGMIAASTERGRLLVLIAVLWLVGANLLAKKAVSMRHVAAFLWLTDFILLTCCLLFTRLDLLLGTALLAAAAHLLIVTTEKYRMAWMADAFVSGGIVIVFGAQQRGLGQASTVLYCGLLLVTILATGWLVHRAQRQNVRNVSAAMTELMEFTGYAADRVRHLWAVSNQELARNWQSAAIAEDDRERLAQWYRDNSELYLFAISGYNLEYKRIRSNLKVLRMGRGACLDYGAGNGELLLDLARRGHDVTYFDVDGATMRFARQRAEKQGLSIRFLHQKDALAAAAKMQGFDTIFSFDVLEHLPDLPGELNFLSSMLNPGGVFVFDVPAGSTKAHPMHLNHALDVLAYMREKGLADRRGLMLRLPFRKDEKYVFQAPHDGQAAADSVSAAGVGPGA
jgi:2-polyprenyl-3-methyl-5-hydroxy-6-metoxy-1,4-benzoquinol methylase